MALLPSTPSTPPLSSQSTAHTARAASTLFLSLGQKTPYIHASPKPPSLQRRYQRIVLHRRILSAGCFSGCFYPAARERSRLICECWLICCCHRRRRLARAKADREPQYLCPGTGCNTNLHKDRADYPACRTFSVGTCVWTGLLIKYPGNVCWLCASEFEVGEVVWAYTIPDVERPACYITWCLNGDAGIILKEEGVPVNARLAGEDDVLVQFLQVALQ
ncbi:hypothetical protein Esi_0031_0091 [Ectocarpus siliculosus]|uniref:Uncharacterized protein n=1 Tax=Ectocarpus siliculosus TaxID=2880 RepID=D8LKW7_ECTSI|nr:hypothetical protein Esi_0031_0091 [Ectocarpus siliculosus]|eukprot:CBN80100.1 hypothetical protein Esi_0031_0091 [Ectocarpus siliculosus]